MKDRIVAYKTIELAQGAGLFWDNIDYRFITQSLLHKWLRENHFLYCIIIPTITGDWSYKVIDIQCNPEHKIERPPYNNVNEFDYSSYEEALEMALQESLKIINNNNNLK